MDKHYLFQCTHTQMLWRHSSCRLERPFILVTFVLFLFLREPKMNAMLMITILAVAVVGTCKYDLGPTCQLLTPQLRYSIRTHIIWPHTNSVSVISVRRNIVECLLRNTKEVLLIPFFFILILPTFILLFQLPTVTAMYSTPQVSTVYCVNLSMLTQMFQIIQYCSLRRISTTFI